jgi:nucleotide-binding universal stress UspA family protein
MTMIVGYAPDERGKAGLHLGAMLARSAGDDLVVCTVVPAPWAPGMARIDAEYRGYLDAAADQALGLARSLVPDDVPVRYERRSSRSAPAGLLEAAREHGANILVAASSASGAFGHVALGSVTDRLVHSSHVSVVLAPRGYRTKPDARVTRVTAAYGGTPDSEHLAVAAAGVAAQVGVELRIASFAVWTRPAYTMRLGTDAEDRVFAEWTRQIEGSVASALTKVEGLPKAPRSVETVVGRGTSWTEAMDDVPWGEGDVLVVGSSELGPVAQVFLGSRASKIVRHSPVPVAVVPRGRAAELADRAVHG